MTMQYVFRLHFAVPFTKLPPFFKPRKMADSSSQHKPGMVNYLNNQAKLSIAPSRKQKENEKQRAL